MGESSWRENRQSRKKQYGIVHFSVKQRTHEIAIRIALGAQKTDVFWFVLSQGMKPGLFGIGLGITFGLIITRFMQRLLFQVHPNDLFTLVTVSFMVTAVALFACWWPAWRAIRIDPMHGLKCE